MSCLKGMSCRHIFDGILSTADCETKDIRGCPPFRKSHHDRHASSIFITTASLVASYDKGESVRCGWEWEVDDNSTS